MEYIGKLFRPPSEANSLIVQVTLGCSHNKCTFCCMYHDKQFTIRPLAQVVKDFIQARSYYHHVDKIFLADGDVLAVSSDYLEQLLIEIKQLFPECNRVALYASAKNILQKTPQQLKTLNQLGLKIAYLGLESGSESILKDVKKNITAQEMIEACSKLRNAGIKSSVTVISGLGGKTKWREHALETAKVLSEMDPDYIGLLTLIVVPEAEIHSQIKSGELQLLSAKETAEETKLLLENLTVTNCLFRSNHASNYLVLKGTLPQDKQKLIDITATAIARGDNYRPEFWRSL